MKTGAQCKLRILCKSGEVKEPELQAKLEPYRFIPMQKNEKMLLAEVLMQALSKPEKEEEPHIDSNQTVKAEPQSVESSKSRKKNKKKKSKKIILQDPSIQNNLTPAYLVPEKNPEEISEISEAGASVESVLSATEAVVELLQNDLIEEPQKEAAEKQEPVNSAEKVSEEAIEKEAPEEEVNPFTSRYKIDIPLTANAKVILDHFKKAKANVKAYVHGGYVRDMYLKIVWGYDKTPHDIDLISPLTPQQVIDLFKSCKEVTHSEITKGRFPVVRLTFADGETIEVATFRKDSHDSHEIERNENGMIIKNQAYGTRKTNVRELDLRINALCYDAEHGEILDDVDGLDDLNKGIIRFVKEPI